MDPRNQPQNASFPQPPQPQDPERKQSPNSNMMRIEDMAEEERAVLKECERESFYYRGLPVSAGCMVGVQYLVKTGRLAPHPKFGSIPKSIIFGFFGYMLGKASYLPVCRQKILDQIPHSKLADAIRGRGNNEQRPEGEMAQESGANKPSTRPGEDYSAFNQNPSGLTESSTPAGIDDRFRPSIDKESTNESTPDDSQKQRVTYEEMRRRNRQQYEESQAKQPPRQPGTPSYKESPLMPQKPWPDPRKPDMGPEPLDPTPPPPPSGPPKRKRTNMWGDPIED